MASSLFTSPSGRACDRGERARSATETEALYVIGEVEGCDVLLADDLTETAGTLTSAARILKERGALDIYAAVAHAVLVDVAVPRLQKI